MFRSKTPEERATADAQRVAKAAEREQREFEQTPIGQAWAAHVRGDRLHQVRLDLSEQTPWLIPMTGTGTFERTTDPNVALNAIEAQGWELVTAGFVFVEEGSMSRDKFLASGQQTSVKGATVGYYVFRRHAVS